jgi:hypothetical protein
LVVLWFLWTARTLVYIIHVDNSAKEMHAAAMHARLDDVMLVDDRSSVAFAAATPAM